MAGPLCPDRRPRRRAHDRGPGLPGRVRRAERAGMDRAAVRPSAARGVPLRDLRRPAAADRRLPAARGGARRPRGRARLLRPLGERQDDRLDPDWRGRDLGRDRRDPAGRGRLASVERALARVASRGRPRGTLPPPQGTGALVHAAVAGRRRQATAHVRLLFARRRPRGHALPGDRRRAGAERSMLRHALHAGPLLLGRLPHPRAWRRLMVSNYDRLIHVASRAQIPLAALFEVTHRCNLGCSHCYLTEGPVGRPRPTRDELALDEVRRALDQLAEAGTFFLTLTGGEVFMRRDFLDIVAHARSLHFSVTIFTTGTL